MMDFKVEYLPTRYRSDKPCAHDDVAYVRLAEVEKLITELEWAMNIIKAVFCVPGDECHQRAQAFLANLAAWRKGQEDKK